MSGKVQVLMMIGVLVFPPTIFAADGVDDERAPDTPDKRSSSDDPAARAFDEGKVHYQSGRFAEAAASFREAQRLKPTWRLYYNIAQSEAAAKRFGLALEAFEAYLAKGGDDVSLERQEVVQDEIRRLREMVGLLEIRAPEGSRIQVDGLDRGTAPLPGAIPVTAGVVHRVSAILEEETLADKAVKVIGGATEQVSWIPENAAPAPEADRLPAGVAPPSQRAENTRLGVIGWSAAGVGAALLAGAVFTGVFALAKDKDIESGCENGKCPADFAGTLDTRDNLALATNVLIGVGSAAAVAGVALVIMAHRRNTAESAGKRRPMVPAPEGLGLSWEF